LVCGHNKPSELGELEERGFEELERALGLFSDEFAQMTELLGVKTSLLDEYLNMMRFGLF
jgi:hypothetical protein